MADKNINNVSAVSSVNDTDTIHITTGNTFAQVSVSTLIAKAKADTLTQVEASLLDKLTDGCFIMHHRKSDNLPVAVKASSWTATQNSGEVADGVLVIDGGHGLVVAPTQAPSTMYWSSSNVTVDSSTFITDRSLLFADFDGKSRTSAILANPTIGGDGAGYAPGFCAAYSRSNGVDYSTTSHPEYANRGMGAGSWWLPSIGELLMIWAHKLQINACLSLISGASTIQDDSHWSSTEHSQNSAWGLYMSYGYMFSNFLKSSTLRCVRPVSAFKL